LEKSFPLCQCRDQRWGCGIDSRDKAALLGHWQEFLPPGFNLYLQDLAPAEQIAILQGFARWVWEGIFGHGKQVKVGSIQTALGATSKTIKLDGFANPLHCPGITSYPAALTMQLALQH